MFGDKLDIDLSELDGRKRPSKYRAVKRAYNGKLYPSIAQANRAAELDCLKSAGEVAWFLEEVTIMLGDVSYRIDFVVAERANQVEGSAWVAVHAEDVKGFETPRFRLVRKLWPKYGFCDLYIIKRGNTEVIEGVTS